MKLSRHNPALLRGILAGAVVLSAAAACSRSDRADAGRDSTQSGAVTVTPADSQAGASVAQPSTGTTQLTGDTVARSRPDTATTAARTAAPRHRRMANRRIADSSGAASDKTVSTVAPDTASAEVAVAADTAANGSANAADSAGTGAQQAVTADTSSAAGHADTAAVAVTDTTADTTATAGYSEMAPDTSVAAGQADTAIAGSTEMARDSAVVAQSDTARVVVADTTAPGQSDTANIQVRTDTTTTETQAQAQTDSAAVPTDTTLGDNAERIRPTEDSTANSNVANQSDSTRIRPPADSAETAANANPSADVAGAAPMGQAATGVEAVGIMSRAGERCVVKNDAEDVWWDMGNSPSALNPCGTGTMTLSSVKTGEK